MIVAGLLLAALGYALFLPVGADWTYAAMFPSLLLVGIAFALVHGPLAIVATDRIASCEQGLAGGLLYTSVQFGAAFGLSAVTAVTTAAGGGNVPFTPLGGYRAGLVVPTAAVVIALLIGVLGMRERRPGRAVRSGRRTRPSGSTEPAGTGSVSRPKEE